MRPPKNKWDVVGDIDLNPRKGHPKRKPEVRIYKSWNFTGQLVKAIEEISPTTIRGILKALVAKRVIQDEVKGLWAVRRACNELRRHGTIIVDASVRKFEAQEYGTEAMIILNPKAKYKFKGDNDGR